EPPHVPYAVPWLRNTLSFVWDTEGFVVKMQKRFGMTTPFRMGVAGESYVYVPAGSEFLGALMRKSIRDVNNKKAVMRALRDQFGVPAGDLPIWALDESGFGAKPAPGFEGWPPERRPYHSQHRDFQAFLAGGAALDAMTAKFVECYTRQLLLPPLGQVRNGGGENDNDKHGTDWIEVPDLYAFWRRHMFHAAVYALCGSHIFDVCPDFADQFWAYDEALSVLLKRVPPWLAPARYAARTKAVESVRRWQASARAKFDWHDQAAVEADWEPIYGARIMRARQVMWRQIGQSETGSAATDLGMIWAANSNIIPASFWALLHVALSPNVTARVRAEVEASISAADANSLDIGLLCSKPLLNSVYLEALRYSVASTVGRNAASPDRPVRLGPGGNWAMATGTSATLIAFSWFGGHDATFWNAGPGGRYPVDAFWAERFLAYPDDPSSGPLLAATTATTTTTGSEGGEDENNIKGRGERTVEDDRAATVVTAGTQGHWYPYGGGSTHCPGRFFAKQELIAALAVLLMNFDVEITDVGAAMAARCDRRYFPLGAMPPDGKIPARIRRR
ncbi:cytochrome P450, partial [Lasiosphaeria miniovina]